jgi:hypothetical protein
MRPDAAVVTDADLGRVNEADPATAAEAAEEQAAEWEQRPGHQLDEPVIADQLGEVVPLMSEDLPGIVVLEGPVAGEVKADDDGQHFT